MKGVLLLVLTSLLALEDVAAIALPDSNYTTFREDLRRVRRRSLLASTPTSYRPKNMSPAACWLLSEEECREQDQAVGFSTRKGGNVNRGTVKVLVVLCRFKDHQGRELPPVSYYDELFNGKGKSEINPIGSIREYLLWSSQATFDVQPWKTTKETEAYYAGGSFGLLGADAMQEMFKPLLTDLFNSGYNFGPLDSDSWGDLDHLVVIHSGYPAEYGIADCTGNPPENRIWSQGTAATGTVTAWLSPDFAFSVSNYAILGAFTGLCKEKPLVMGKAVHEFLHGFGLFDLYDLDENDEPIKLGGTGKFGIMSNMHGWNQNGQIPGHMNAFSRIFVGWLEPVELTQDGFFAIQPSELSSQVYAIRKGFPRGEYIIIENRQPYQWDSDWSSSGLVIFRVDDNADMQKDRGYPGHPDWPKNHYQVSVLQADRKFDIEKGVSVGDGDDMWRKGDVLSPGGDFPNTDSISGGKRQRTGIEIEVLSDSQYVMLFKVSGVSQN